MTGFEWRRMRRKIKPSENIYQSYTVRVGMAKDEEEKTGARLDWRTGRPSCVMVAEMLSGIAMGSSDLSKN